MTFTLPKLPYAYDALEPLLSAIPKPQSRIRGKMVECFEVHIKTDRGRYGKSSNEFFRREISRNRKETYSCREPSSFSQVLKLFRK